MSLSENQTKNSKEKQTILPNIAGLKDLACFNIDCSFVQQYGSRLFNYSGEVNEEYHELCKELSSIIEITKNDIQAITTQIPVTTQNGGNNDSK